MQTLTHDLIPVLWLIWLAYWLVASLRTKPVRRRESLSSRLSHIVLLVVGVALLMSHRLGGPLLNLRFLPAAIWTFWLGTALVAAGIALAIWARVHLAGNWSGTVTLKEDHSLTRDGPYRFVRHPIYTGILLGILGSAIAEGEWRGLVGLGLITLSFLRKSTIEEQFLTAQFGDAYTRYRAEVAALIPWPRR
ncbi:MAG TPA: isoprenylcysteine carboxylmethyltransferase family protein [Acetobacteraceae bacterium]|jgi:protein-S-isoprenylcysteine O-methyltransferase Ste14|nr:isoprenylcysteine carboxylmethyltransferase family protein [Acetobacteraceae bacterium]